jgi:hypothetical protein
VKRNCYKPEEVVVLPSTAGSARVVLYSDSDMLLESEEVEEVVVEEVLDDSPFFSSRSPIPCTGSPCGSSLSLPKLLTSDCPLLPWLPDSVDPELD